MRTLTSSAVPGRDTGVESRILAQLRSRRAMHIGEVSQRLDLKEDAVRTAMERLIADRRVERLRPIGCDADHHDFFALPRPAAPTYQRHEVFLDVGGQALRLWATTGLACALCPYEVAENHIG